jgi:DNA-binding transcriptional LysR family regulator
VARANGFREGAHVSGSSASGLSEAVSRLEAQLGVRLLHRTTRSVVPTEAGDVSKRRRPAFLTFARESSSLMPYSPGGRGR